MAIDIVTSIDAGKRPRRPPSTRGPRRPAKPAVKVFSEIEADLNNVKCTLACASMALGHAQDVDDGDLAAQAWYVINACVGRLTRLEDDLDSWHVSVHDALKGMHS